MAVQALPWSLQSIHYTRINPFVLQYQFKSEDLNSNFGFRFVKSENEDIVSYIFLLTESYNVSIISTTCQVPIINKLKMKKYNN